jgi:ribosomal protein L1
LLFCAKVDQVESVEEIELIKSKTDPETFDKLYKEFCEDCEDDCFEKIEDAIGKYPFSPLEIAEIKKEVLEVFNSDKKFQMKEKYLDKVLDNILY